MSFTEQQAIFQIETMADKLYWKRGMVAAVASRFGIVGASEPNLVKASAKTKDLNSQTAADLRTLLSRFTKMAQAFDPFSLRLDDPDRAKQLLEDFEAGKVVVRVTREEQPGSLIYGVHLIEQISSGKLFSGIYNSNVRWSAEGKPIADESIATAAANILRDMGHGPCRVVDTRMRVTEPQIAKTLLDLGFVLQEQNNGTN